MTEYRESDESLTPTSELVGVVVSSLGMLLFIIGVPAAIFASTFHTTSSLLWGMPTLVVGLIMVAVGLVFVPPGRRQ